MAIDTIFVASGVRRRASLRVLLSRAWLVVRAWWIKRRTRHALIEMTEEQLRDIGITRSEAARLQALNAQLAQNWRRMDPLLVGIQRYALDQPGRERIVIDGNVAPLDETKYGWLLSILGEPTRQMITTAANEGDRIDRAFRTAAPERFGTALESETQAHAIALQRSQEHAGAAVIKTSSVEEEYERAMGKAQEQIGLLVSMATVAELL